MDQGQSNRDTHRREDDVCVLCVSVEFIVEIKAKLSNWSRNGAHHEATADWEHKIKKKFNAAFCLAHTVKHLFALRLPHSWWLNNRSFLNSEGLKQPIPHISPGPRYTAGAGLEKGPGLTTSMNSSERSIFLSYPVMYLISDHSSEIGQLWINIFLLQSWCIQLYQLFPLVPTLVTETWWQKQRLHSSMSGNQSYGMRVSNNRFIKTKSLLIK